MLHHQSFQWTGTHLKVSTQFPKHPTVAAGINSDTALGKESNLHHIAGLECFSDVGAAESPEAKSIYDVN
jgi:hypothetical protein